jgi:hypothetical protein
LSIRASFCVFNTTAIKERFFYTSSLSYFMAFRRLRGVIWSALFAPRPPPALGRWGGVVHGEQFVLRNAVLVESDYRLHDYPPIHPGAAKLTIDEQIAMLP